MNTEPGVNQEPEKAKAATGASAFLARLGPGLITGAADDDPSGIATHSQIGAQFGYSLSWTFVLSFPLMALDFLVALTHWKWLLKKY